VMNQENVEIQNELQGPANEEVVMDPQVRNKRDVILPAHLKDFVLPTWKKGSKK
ncbi:hypothetical protein A2U01_0045875, partial [Trifolium medium]|nr:hypothetical protein [Trifolium medium]